MIERKYDLKAPYRVLFYKRMSDSTQNPRSPEQQDDSIRERMRQCGCPWTVVKDYVDRSIKGRYFRRREQLQHMLRDIEMGLVTVDLVVVDTYERFGRAEEFDEVRRKLRDRHGVLIVAADTHFADPTGIVGKAIGMVEQIRSTEDGRVKAHNVIRGKRDTLRLKRWPGGPAPFGYRLKQGIDGSGPHPRMYSTLEPDPLTYWIVRRLFELAHAHGWGTTLLAQALNRDPEVPDEHKPFYAPTVGWWLDNEIYAGVGVWGDVCTDIIDDARVIVPNPDRANVLRVEAFCEPLVDPQVFYALRAAREARANTREARREAAAATAASPGAEPEPAKLIRPLSPGLSLKHDLSGLVRCGACGCCMVAKTSGRKSKAGKEYVYFNCPRHNDGACANAHHVPVPALRAAVYATLRQRLFPGPTDGDEIPAWFAPLVDEVDREVARLRQSEPDARAAVEEQVRQLDEQLAGWSLSLAKRELAQALRRDIEASYGDVVQRRDALRRRLEEEAALREHLQGALDPRRVLEQLHRLDRVMASTNASLANLELGRHIEQVKCFPDGRAVLFGTWLGVLEGADELLGRRADLAQVDPPSSMPPSAASAEGSATSPSSGDASPLFGPARPRRLARRRVGGLAAPEGDTAFVPPPSDAVLDPRRFEGLAGCFRWEEPITLGKRSTWPEQHGREVAALLASDPARWTLVAMSAHFGVSVPTIRKALRLAGGRKALPEQGPGVGGPADGGPQPGQRGEDRSGEAA